jgi:hypothetical protein
MFIRSENGEIFSCSIAKLTKTIQIIELQLKYAKDIPPWNLEEAL